MIEVHAIPRHVLFKNLFEFFVKIHPSRGEMTSKNVESTMFFYLK